MSFIDVTGLIVEYWRRAEIAGSMNAACLPAENGFLGLRCFRENYGVYFGD